MPSNNFNAASNPADIPPHDGVTHLMFAPEDGTEPAIVARWLGLRDAITLAGGHVQVIAGDFQYPYARDLFIILGDSAYHPTLTFAQDGDERLDFRRRMLLPFIAHYGYAMRGLNTLPDYGIDGGNILPLPQHGAVLSGTHSIYGEYDDLIADQLRAQKAMVGEQNMRAISAHATTWHIDSVAGALPDGRVLIKLDETAEEYELRDAGVHDAYLAATGVAARHVQRVAAKIGRENILTFSILPHADADVVCGVDALAQSAIASRAFGLVANGINVNGTWIAETPPPALAARLAADGIRMIGPRDVGVETFLYGDEGFVGGARCLTLAVTHQRHNRF